MALLLQLHVLFLIICSVFAVNDSPFCVNICSCSRINNKLVVDCTKATLDVTYLLYNETSFVDSSNNNSLYLMDILNMSGISFGHLHQVIPSSPIEVLDMTGTGLTDIIDEAFRNLKQLIELRLGNNRLERLTPTTLKGLRKDGADYPMPALKTLVLSNNRFHSIHSDAFQHIEHTLENLYLDGNPLKILDQSTRSAIYAIPNLKVLDLSRTEISELPENFLHTPGVLKELYLSDNKITNVRKLSLEWAHVLERLVLNGNPITNITKETAFPQMKTLKILHLCAMPELETVGNHSLCELSALEELHLSNNPKLKHIGHSALIQPDPTPQSEVPIVRRIKKLFIGDNKLTHLNVELQWDLMDEIDVFGNPWTCECENQWMVDILIPILCRLNKDTCKELVCEAPIEMEGFTFKELHESKANLRCLDAYGRRPDLDGIILVCFLMGLLIGIVVILTVAFAWKRWGYKCYGSSSPAGFSRQFYGRTSNNIHDDF